MPRNQLDGTQLEYIQQGQGDPIALVHATLSDCRSWALQMDAFAETYPTIS